MMLLWLPFLLLCPLAMFLMMRWGMDHGAHQSHAEHAQTLPASGPDPIDIARRRLASGDITTTEFEGIRRAIS